MSKPTRAPEPQSDGCNVICPHCLNEYQAEGEDYSEFDVEEECEGCGKKFMRCTSFEVTHHTRPLTTEEAEKSEAGNAEICNEPERKKEI